MDQQTVTFLQLAITFVGAGLGTTVVGLVFNRKFSHDLEIQKAFFTRGNRIHERQLDVLQKLYRHFTQAQGLLQRMTSAGRMANEITPQEYALKVTDAMTAAFDELLNGKLLLPVPLGQECDKFFQTVFEAQQNFTFANFPTLTPDQQAEAWRKAADVAFDRVPKVLQRIEDAARAVIHG